MAKKQEVVEKEFTLDLGNLSKIGKPTPKAEEATRVAKVDKPSVPTVKKPPTIKKSRGEALKTVTKVSAVVNSDTKDKKHLRLVVSNELVVDFEAFFKRFVEETETYWVNTSRVHIFVLGTRYLEQKYKKANTYHKAPEDFIKFISRKGNRAKTDESTKRKLNPVPMFFEVSSDVFQTYFDIIYSFLLKNNDVHNTSYSASYFFQDFVDLLDNSFKSFATYGRKNS